jgi:hypothetical protein
MRGGGALGPGRPRCAARCVAEADNADRRLGTARTSCGVPGVPEHQPRRRHDPDRRRHRARPLAQRAAADLRPPAPADPGQGFAVTAYVMSPEAQRLDLLAATQIITDAEVAHCWELIRHGIRADGARSGAGISAATHRPMRRASRRTRPRRWRGWSTASGRTRAASLRSGERACCTGARPWCR